MELPSALLKVDPKCVLKRGIGYIHNWHQNQFFNFLINFVCTFVPDYLISYMCFLLYCQITHQGVNNTSCGTHCLLRDRREKTGRPEGSPLFTMQSADQAELVTLSDPRRCLVLFLPSPSCPPFPQTIIVHSVCK